MIFVHKLGYNIVSYNMVRGHCPTVTRDCADGQLRFTRLTAKMILCERGVSEWVGG